MHADRLTSEMATQAWKPAPRVYRTDLLYAVGQMQESHSWAKRFLSVSHLDPLERVIVAHISAEGKQDNRRR